jgi:MFS family permease
VQIALALFGLSGAVANAMGLLIGGAFGEISGTGQSADWRWFFRFICFVS